MAFGASMLNCPDPATSHALRVSRTVIGTRDEADAALTDLRTKATEAGAERPQRRGRKPSRRAKRSGAISEIGHNRWLLGAEAPPDPLTGSVAVSPARYAALVSWQRSLWPA